VFGVAAGVAELGGAKLSPQEKHRTSNEQARTGPETMRCGLRQIRTYLSNLPEWKDMVASFGVGFAIGSGQETLQRGHSNGSGLKRKAKRDQACAFYTARDYSD
jgi:hypothetical protein